MEHLDGREPKKDKLNNSFEQLLEFLEKYPENVGKGIKQKAIGYLQKVHEGIENTLAIHAQNTY